MEARKPAMQSNAQDGEDEDEDEDAGQDEEGGDGEYDDYIKMKGLHEYLFMYNVFVFSCIYTL